MLPARPTQAQVLWFLSANHGIWAANVPLWKLPPAVGMEYLRLCQSLQPWQNVLLERIAEKED